MFEVFKISGIRIYNVFMESLKNHRRYTFIEKGPTKISSISIYSKYDRFYISYMLCLVYSDAKFDAYVQNRCVCVHAYAV